jgi:ABC-type transport system substrate-binding protein
MANSVLTGAVDIANVSGIDTVRLDADKSLGVYPAQNYSPNLLTVNEDQSRPGNDLKVRLAVATALDPKAWDKAANNGTGILTSNLQATPNGFCYSDLKSLMPTPSVAKAKQMLVDDGYAVGADGKLAKDGKPLSLTVIGITTQNAGPEYISSTLQQVGIDAKLVNGDLATFARNYVNGNYDVAVAIFGNTVPIAGTAAQFYVGPFSPAGANRSRSTDAQFERLVANAYAVPFDQACSAWKAVNTRMLEQGIAMPMSATTAHWYSKKGTFKYQASVTTMYPYTIRRV